MKSRLSVLMVVAVALLAVAPARADDRRPDKGRLVVMTFNTEFMWDGDAPEEGQVQFDRKGDPDAAAEHMAKVAQVIISADADIVNLVEVENLAAVNKLNSTFLQGRGYVAYFAQGRDTTTARTWRSSHASTQSGRRPGTTTARVARAKPRRPSARTMSRASRSAR